MADPELRIGVDFDNTIVRYDDVFYRIALAEKLIPVELPPDKIAPVLQYRETGWQNINHEASQPPLYYLLAGFWWRVENWCGLDGGRALYGLRFLNLFLIATLVWLSYAAARLAFHKIPRHYFFVDNIPLGATGKSSRLLMQNRLPTLQQPFTPPHVAPRTTMEQTLARLWAEVLQVAQPGIHDHFFDSGGDSLGAVRLLAAISEELNRDQLPLGLLMEAPTIADATFAMNIGTKKGDTRLGPFSMKVRMFSSNVAIPPVPLPMITPMRLGSSGLFSRQASRTAWTAAPIANCENRS